jgi:hypothetical protein
MPLNIDAVTVGLVAFIAGIGQECAKELFTWFRHYREKAGKYLSVNNGQKPK